MIRDYKFLKDVNFPSDLKKLSENNLQELSNEVRSEMINAVVIPQINDILKEYKIQLHAIDLRWGLTAEDTSTSGLGALEHCLREVQKSTPFFISLLGERYGWCPEEYKISNRPEFKWIKTQPPGYSITHLEVLQGVLKSWGKPIHGFSYERQANFIDSMQDEKAKNIFEFDYKV